MNCIDSFCSDSKLFIASLPSVSLDAVGSFAVPTSNVNVRRCLKIYMTTWSKDTVPADFENLQKLMILSVNATLNRSKADSQTRKYSIDLLSPGLNLRMEQKAILTQEYLFQTITTLFTPIIENVGGENVLLAFPSIGDAAGNVLKDRDLNSTNFIH